MENTRGKRIGRIDFFDSSYGFAVNFTRNIKIKIVSIIYNFIRKIIVVIPGVNARIAISLLGTLIVVVMSAVFQLRISESFTLSLAARIPNGRSSILWLKHSVEL